MRIFGRLWIIAVLVVGACSGGDGASDVAGDATGDAFEALDGVPGDVVEAPDADVPALADALDVDACVPICSELVECGDDGCGGSCGDCGADAWCEFGECVHVDYEDCYQMDCGVGPVFGTPCGECEEGFECNLRNRCVPVCDWETQKPTSWGPAALIETVAFMPDGDVASLCHDYTGDEVGDSSADEVLRSLLTGGHPDKVFVPEPPVALVMEGYDSPDAETPFRIDVVEGVIATPAGPDGEPPAAFQVSIDTYDTYSTCLPRTTLPNAVFGDATLWAGPGRIAVQRELRQTVLEFTILAFHASGTFIGASVGEGFRVPGASVSGVLTREDVVANVASLQASCDSQGAEEKDAWCETLQSVQTLLMAKLDFHLEEDGTIHHATSELPGNALVLCFQVKADTPAVVTGYAP